MRQRAELVIRQRRDFTSRAGKPESFELVTVAPPQYWALLWPQHEDVSSLFRMATLPVRIVPVALLWATSKPGRLFAGLAALVVSVVLIIR